MIGEMSIDWATEGFYVQTIGYGMSCKCLAVDSKIFLSAER